MQKITPNLWFDRHAEEAAEFYISIFKGGSRVVSVSRYTEAGQEVHKMPAGAAMVVEFELAGQRFLALNGGPLFKFNESVSFVIDCKDQSEVDYFWEQLSEGGDESAQACGWLKDKYGLSWQVVPTVLNDLLGGPHALVVMETFLKMKKINIAELQQAASE